MAVQLVNRRGHFAPRPRGAAAVVGWVDVAVVGAGPAGLAVSSELARVGVRHVVLERGRVGESWRTQRWDSFRLNSQGSINRVPDELLAAPADRFPSAGELIVGLERLAEKLPVAEGVEVLRAEPAGEHWQLVSSEGRLLAGTMVVASGFQNVPRMPAYATALPGEIAQLHVADYRSPRDHDDAVLVIGGGQSGVQVAADLLQAGRRVYISTSLVGRMPRQHRGRDAFVWLRDTGEFDLPREYAEPATISASLPQISGASNGGSISYQHLARHGATLLGRTLGWDGHRLRLAPDVGENIRYADQVSQLFRATWDRHAGLTAGGGETPWQDDPADAPAEDLYELSGPESLDLTTIGISTLIWATGFNASLNWLPANSVGRDGRAQRPGLHVIGAPWLTHRASNNLYGIPTDAARAARELTRDHGRAAA
jgi:putative flavoprotein involved in K+ transport